MGKLTRYQVTYQGGTTVGAFGSQQSIDKTQPQTIFKAKNLLDLFNKLNQYLADSCIYEDEIVDINWIGMTIESRMQKSDKKYLNKKFRENENENRHTENYLLLANVFGTQHEIESVEKIILRNESRGYTSQEDNNWMLNNIGKYFYKIRHKGE